MTFDKEKTFEPIRDYPAYSINSVEYEAAIRHNLSGLTKQQLIDIAVMAAIEAERSEIDYRHATGNLRESTVKGITLAVKNAGLSAKNERLNVKKNELLTELKRAKKGK